MSISFRLSVVMAPVFTSPAVRMNIAAMVIVALLLKPEIASLADRKSGRKTPISISVVRISSATRSTRSFSVANSTIAATTMVQTMRMSIMVRREAPCQILRASTKGPADYGRPAEPRAPSPAGATAGDRLSPRGPAYGDASRGSRIADALPPARTERPSCQRTISAARVSRSPPFSTVTAGPTATM